MQLEREISALNGNLQEDLATMRYEISANAEAITSKVSAGEVVSVINQSADKISLSANRIEIFSTYFHLSDDGQIVATKGIIGNPEAASPNKWTIGGDDTRAWMYSGDKSSMSSASDGVYIGTDGIAIRGTSSAGVNNWMELKNGNIFCTSIQVYDDAGSAYGTIMIDGTEGGVGRINFPRGCSVGAYGGTSQDFDCFPDAYFLAGLYSRSGKVDGTTSDIRIKENIEDISLEDASSFIMRLQPKSFHLKESKDESRSVGFVAQDLHKALPADWDIWFEKKGLEGIRYPSIIAPLVKMVQDHERRLNAEAVDSQT